MKEAAAAIGAVLIFGLCYFFLKLPIAHTPLPFYDDAESLYHLLSLLSGQIPYRDDFNHHFEGFLLQFLPFVKAFGYSEFLVKQVALVSQALTGLGIYFTLRTLGFRIGAVLGGLMYVSAREPWVLGFFQQYQINLAMIYTLLLCICGLRGNSSALGLAYVLAGLGFVYDQRALFLVLIPGATSLILVFHAQVKFWTQVKIGLLYLVLPGLALSYLWHHDALTPFFEQTFIFPAQFRVGSSSIGSLIELGLTNLVDAVRTTPVHFLGCLIGIVAITRTNWIAQPQARQIGTLLLLTLIPLTIMPFFGGRTYDYYTLTWMPYISLMSIVGLTLFNRVNELVGRAFSCVLCLPVATALYTAQINIGKYPGYLSDGLNETVEFLGKNMSPSDSIYVWGYRLEIYVRLKSLAPNPFGSRLLIHPDYKITEPQARAEHVYPKYEKIFLDWLSAKPPTYIVWFERSTPELSSKANTALRDSIDQHYKLVFQISKRDFMDKECSYWIYRYEH